MSAMPLRLRDGRISEHITVQAWDEVNSARAKGLTSPMIFS